MNTPEAISTQELSDYLAGSLGSTERQRIDAALQLDPFLADAIEGLTEYGDPAILAHVTHQINNQLRQQVASRRRTRRGKDRSLPNYKIWISIMVFLVLVLIAYFAIMKIS